MTTSPSESVAKRSSAAEQELRVYMHSDLFFWWPVWAAAFVFAALTAVENRHLLLVPQGTVIEGNTAVAPEGTALVPTDVHISGHRWMGACFVLVLFVVVACSPGWMRGWQAYTFWILVGAIVAMLGWLQAYGTIYGAWTKYVDVRINLGGYLVIGGSLFLLWLWYYLVVDGRTYVVFTMSQVAVHSNIGETEHVFDAGGVAVEMRSRDLFRWFVGWRAADLVLRVGGPNGREIEMRNVLWARRQLVAIEKLLRTKDVE